MAAFSGLDLATVAVAHLPDPMLLREPTTSRVGKRYSGFPSTNSPVNTPSYGAVSVVEWLVLGVGR
jgi:hypothetical protein